MIGVAPQLAAADFADPARLAAIGATQGAQAQRELADEVARFGFYQQRPRDALNALVGQIQGVPLAGTGTSQTAQPYFTNPVASGLGGAFAGASLANALKVSPWLGALGGAGLSLLG
jgi:hypothetical protein